MLYNILNAFSDLENIPAAQFQGSFPKFSLSFDVTKHHFCCLPKQTPCSCLFRAGSPNFFTWGPQRLLHISSRV